MLKKTVLDNGVRILFDHLNHTESFCIGVFIRSGSKYENESNNGISHFIEHLLIRNNKGQTNFNEMGAVVNAFTTKEYTCFYLNTLSEFFHRSVNLFYDLIFDPFFNPDDIDKEKNVILNEINLYKDDPKEVCILNCVKTSLGGHPLAFEILGPEENIQSFSVDLIEKYYKSFYVPEHSVVVVSGKISSQIEEEIVELFSKIPQGAEKKIKVVQPCFQGGTHFEERDTSQIHLCLQFETLGRSGPISDIFSLFIINFVLGGYRNSRLHRTIRKEHGLVYQIHSYPQIYEEIGLLNVYLNTTEHHFPLVQRMIKETLLTLRKSGITIPEFMVAKANFKSQTIFSMEKRLDRIFFFGQNELLKGFKYDIKDIHHILNTISIEQVNNQLTQILTGPQSISIVSKRGKIPINLLV